jgi:hypothetical protein
MFGLGCDLVFYQRSNEKKTLSSEWQVLYRVFGMGIVSHFEMEMGSGGTTGASYQGNFLSLLDPASFFNQKF